MQESLPKNVEKEKTLGRRLLMDYIESELREEVSATHFVIKKDGERIIDPEFDMDEIPEEDLRMAYRILSKPPTVEEKKYMEFNQRLRKELTEKGKRGLPINKSQNILFAALNNFTFIIFARRKRGI